MSAAALTAATACRDATAPPDGPDVRQEVNVTVTLDVLPAITRLRTLDVAGSTRPSNLRVEVYGGAATATGRSGEDGGFVVPVTLNPNRVNELRVVAFDASGSPGDTAAAVVRHDDVPPPPPEFDLPAYTNRSPIVVSGTAEAGAAITVTVGPRVAAGQADANGRFSLSIELDPDTANVVGARATDEAGNEGAAAEDTIVHDGIAPALEIVSPVGASFDTDGDLRVNIELVYSDSGPSGIDASSLSVTNDRPIGGGSAIGGVDPRQELAGFFDSVSEGAASYNARLEHEFPAGVNVLTVSIADRAGNVVTRADTFSVAGTGPRFRFTAPADGGTTPAPPEGFTVAVAYADTAGLIDMSSLVITADRTLTGRLQQDGTIPDDVPAGANLAGLFAAADTGAAATLGGRYAFPAGPNTLTGVVSDRAGNVAAPDTVVFNATAPLDNLMVIVSSAAPGATGHVVPIGLINGSDLGGIDFTFNFDPNVLTVDSVRAGPRVSFPARDNSDVAGASGAVRTVLVDLGGAPIPAGQGIVLLFYVTVAPGAAPGDVPITLSDVTAATPTGTVTPIVTTQGWVTIQ